VPFVRLAKIELKKMCGGENKKYRRVGLSVGSVTVQFQYGLYVVGHLSKLAFHFMFIVVCLVVVVSSVRLACNAQRLGEGREVAN
jgi:hypothetical protein